MVVFDSRWADGENGVSMRGGVGPRGQKFERVRPRRGGGRPRGWWCGHMDGGWASLAEQDLELAFVEN